MNLGQGQWVIGLCMEEPRSFSVEDQRIAAFPRAGGTVREAQLPASPLIMSVLDSGPPWQELEQCALFPGNCCCLLQGRNLAPARQHPTGFRVPAGALGPATKLSSCCLQIEWEGIQASGTRVRGMMIVMLTTTQ